MSYDLPYEEWAFNDKSPKGPWRGTRSCPRDGTIFLIWRDCDQRVRNASIDENGKWHIWPDSQHFGVYMADKLPDYWMPWPDSPDVFAKMAAALRTYKLRRYSHKGLMAEGAEVRASSPSDAIGRARALFREPEYQHDRFEIESVE